MAWVDLARLSDGVAVAYAVAGAVGALVDPRRGPLASLTTHLSGRRLLLCLDNAEHVLDEVAEVVDAAARAGPGVTVLVTSREPLRVAGEQVWRVPPLPDGEAAALLVERARLVRPAYEPSVSGAAAISSIVRHLDGIPLAIELAAGWFGTLSAEQVLAGLDDRFRLLVRGPRNAQRRHQTMVACIGWSHALLDEVDRVVLRRLSVFAGSFGLDAASHVAGGSPVSAEDLLASVARLVDKSMVMAEESAGEVRYHLLESIRTYAAGRLAEALEETGTRRRHLEWHLDFLETADEWREVEPDRWRAAAQQEYAELRAALEWALDGGDPEAGRRLAGSLAWLWHLNRHGGEGVRYLRRAIALAPEERSVQQARLLTGLALVLDTASPLDAEYDTAVRAVELATDTGDDQLRALALTLAAVGACYTDFDQACALAEQAAALAPEDGLTRAGALAVRGLVMVHRDQHDEAETLLADLTPRLARLHRGIASSVLGFRATSALATGDLTRAEQLAQDGLGLAEPLGDYLRVGMARTTLAVVHTRAGDLDAAAGALYPLLQHLDTDGAFVPRQPYALALLALHRDDDESAIAWLRKGAEVTDRGLDSWIAAQALAELGAVLAARGAAADTAVVIDRAVAAATRLGMPQVLATARLAQADLTAATSDGASGVLDLVHEALELQVRHGLLADLPASLEALARHGASSRPSADDAELLGAADAARSALRLPRTPRQDRQCAATLAALESNLGVDTVAPARAAGAQLSLGDAVRFARRGRGIRGRPTSGWASLTPTELEVTALVTGGLSNPEIATRLLMGRGTVKTHLAHIYSKLQVSNRTQLATLASQRADETGIS